MNTLKAYGITAAVTEGPMVLSIVLLFAARRLLGLWGAGYGIQEVYLITTTYIMIFSQILANVFLMFAARFISDCIYENKKDQILPSFFSVTAYLLLFGGIVGGIYGRMLDIPLIHKVLNFLQFEIMLVLWVQMTYLSAIKKYLKVLTGFLVSALGAAAFSLVFLVLGMEPLTAVYLGSTAGYFVMMVLYTQELIRFYPWGQIRLGTIFYGLDQYKILMGIGFFTALGLFGHNFVYWFGPYGTQVMDYMIYCMKYDVASFFASLTIVPFLVIFVVALEVNFYKAYRKYFDTILYGGTLTDIRTENKNLGKTLFRELAHVFEIQFFVEIFCVTFLGNFLQTIGFDREMLIIFRYLCVGCCFYVMVKSLIIIDLYFDNRKGAFVLAFSFAALSIGCSAAAMAFGVQAYGLGFLGAGAVVAAGGMIHLYRYLKGLEYQVFCRQPLFVQEPDGIFHRLADRLDTIDRKGETSA